MPKKEFVASAAAVLAASPLRFSRSRSKGESMSMLRLLAAGFALIPSFALSAVLVVDDDGLGSAADCNAGIAAFSTIGAAISAASNGDQIVVCPGTYFERINFGGKAITVRSRDGAAVTTIDGGRAGNVVTFATAETRQSRLEGFTIRNGRGPIASDGGGIRIRQASPSIVGNIVTDNEACQGAGIGVNGGSPLIQGNTINLNRQFGCSTGGGGGGIAVLGAGPAEIIGNVISNNSMPSAGSGGGIDINGGGATIITNNIISGNSAGVGFSPCSTGGGIGMVNNTNAEIIQNIITGNTAGCGGGIAWTVPSGSRGPRLVNNTIADNNATGSLAPSVLAASGLQGSGFQSQVELVNNIVVARPGQTAVHCAGLNQPQFRSNDVFSPSGAAYSGVCNPTGTNGNISVDPMFVNAAGGNYHLQAGSPAIDVGDNSAIDAPQISDNVWALITRLDIDGDPRVMDGANSAGFVVDMGADEVLGEKPAARCAGTSAIYDQATDRLVVHSGAGCAGGHPNDTWALTDASGVGGPAHWTKIATGGPATHNHSAVYDAANNRMIVYGGCLGGCLPIQASVFVLSDANGSGGAASWSMLPTASTPPGRHGHKAFYDPASNRMIVWGGQDGGGSVASQFREVWVLTNGNGLGGTSAWSRLTTLGGVPEAAYFSSAVYDAANNRLIVFGGIDATGVESNAVWVLSSANGLGGAPVWTNTVARNAAGAPSPRAGAQAIYNATLNTMVIFDGGPAGDVWRLTNANGLGGPSVWSQISVAGGPGGSRAHYNGGAYDPVSDAMIVFANNAAGNGNEAWVLRPRGAPLDMIAPTTSASVAPAANAAGWNNSAVTVTLSATDNAGGSGVQSITYDTGGAAVTVQGATASFTVSAEGTTTITYRAKDNAGNVEAAKTRVVKIDMTAPSTAATRSVMPNPAGWNNTDVVISLAGTDNPGGSGMQSLSYALTNGGSTTGASVNGAAASITVSAEGVNTVTYFAIDNAGNVEAQKTLTVRIDRTAPNTSASATPAPNASGWNSGDVAVNLSAVDNAGGSGVQSIRYSINGAPATVSGAAASFTVSAEGINTITYQATDAAGNVEAAKTLIVRIDRTAPRATLTLSPGVLWPPNHRLVNVTPSLSIAPDASGPVTVSGPVVTSNEPVDGLGDGDTAPDWIVSAGRLQLRAERSGGGSGRVYTVTYTLTDRAGNTSQVSATVTVPHSMGR
jgi:hypothetical protein